MPTTREKLLSHWRALGKVELDELSETRNLLHWAVQIPASIGYTYVTPVPDWSHVSLSGRFVDGSYVLVSGIAGDTFCCGLRLKDATLMLFDVHGGTVSTHALHGSTLDEGYAWLDGEAKALLGDASLPLIRPDHTLPAHSVGEGHVFAINVDTEFEEIAGWYANAEHAFRALLPLYPEASAIRCWPHHFDLAFLLTLDPDKDAEEARSIGVGFAPGDGSYDEPYFYVTPWPYPDKRGLPFLEGGHWHVEHWIGAVLVGSELLEAGVSGEEVAYLVDFLKSGVTASQKVL